MANEKVRYQLAPLDRTYPTLQVCAICKAKAIFATIFTTKRNPAIDDEEDWWGIDDYVCGSEECFNLWILQQ